MASLSARTPRAKRGDSFPLRKHKGRGFWIKKVRGKVHYFGRIDKDPEGRAALEEWLRVKDELIAGRTPRAKGDGLTLAYLCNSFLTAKKRREESGELTQRTFADYKDVCERLVKELGRQRLVSDLQPADFDALRGKWSKAWGPTTVSNYVGRARAVFRFAHTEGLVEVPVRLGSGFAKPSAKTMRQHRAAKAQEHGARMFAADEIKAILAAAPSQLKAMVLLGINAGLGQSDCAGLPQSAIRGEWLEFPRPKTGIPRRVPLWQETREAVEAAIQARPEPRHAADAGLVFLTRCHVRWVRVVETPILDDEGEPVLDDAGQPKKKIFHDDAISKEFAKLLRTLGIKRHGLNFYGLRHTFSTIAEETKDFPAVSAIMGHADASMAAAYRERIDDSRLLAVTNHVHAWLYPVVAEKGGAE